jgi:uncharacterized tellurite resistance protein B-like protein
MRSDKGDCNDTSGRRKIHLTPKSAMYLAALTVIASDGSVVNAETSDMGKIVRGDQENFSIACQTFANTSYEECVSLVAHSLTEQQQVALIAILLDLAMADGVLANAEERLISAYVSKFGISPKIFRELCHYISMKNNLALFD